MAIVIPQGREGGQPFVETFVRNMQASGLLEQIQREAGLRVAVKAQPK
jgi:hypothetical protein